MGREGVEGAANKGRAFVGAVRSELGGAVGNEGVDGANVKGRGERGAAVEVGVGW